MEITREKHLQYMTKMTPILVAALAFQSVVYFHFFPALAQDVTIFLSVGLILIIGFFNLHNHFHQVTLKENYVQIKIKPLKYQEDIVYRNITKFDLIPSKHGFSNLRLHVRDGRSFMLFYVDEADKIVSKLKEKQAA